MRLILFAMGAVAALAGCGEPTPPTPPADEAPAPASSQAVPAAPPAKEPGATPAPAAPEDACGAAERQGWVGRPRAELPSPPAGANWRIYETGQPVTQDLRPDRLNIEIDPARQTVVRVSCG